MNKQKILRRYNFKKSDFIVSFYTVQFIRQKFRQSLINKIYKSLNWGGGFFFVEKVRSYALVDGKVSGQKLEETRC